MIKTIGDLTPDPRNARAHTPRNVGLIETALNEVGAARSIVIDEDGVVLAGNATIEAAAQAGIEKVQVVDADGNTIIAVRRSGLTPEQKTRLALFDNRSGELADWDAGVLAALAEETDLSTLFRDDELAALLERAGSEILDAADAEPRASLAERFGVPPFSVLDARQGYWQARKRAWIALGIQSELGRGGGVHQYSDAATIKRQGGSIGMDGSKVYVAKGNYSKSGAVVANQPGDEAAGLVKARGYEAIPGGAGASSVVPVNGRRARMANAGMQDSADSLRIDDYRQSAKRATAAESGSGGPGTMDAQRKAWRSGQGVARSYAVNEWVRDTLPDQTGLSANQSGTSIFDPVLCELVYRWFCPDSGAVLDPFAGGSVRGIVASLLGRQYTGLDLRPEQIAANETQATEITPDALPRWVVGDSRDVGTLAPGSYDLIFSCPPYADLEVYSDDPRDLSTLEYQDFLSAYRAIIAAAVGMLRPDRFAVFVVGDVRDKRGFYRNFVGATVDAFQDAGAILYNEAILVTAVGSLPIRIAKQFEGYRKLGKTHQNVLVFYKGDPKRIKEFGPVEMGEIDDDGLDTVDS